jgi:hypothetical protein
MHYERECDFHFFFSEVTKLLLYAAQSSHELVPPDVSLMKVDVSLLHVFNLKKRHGN